MWFCPLSFGVILSPGDIWQVWGESRIQNLAHLYILFIPWTLSEMEASQKRHVVAIAFILLSVNSLVYMILF